MNARFLSTFCAVARFGSLNAAARHLGLSSASVGEQIRALEKDLNARLVSRQGRGIAADSGFRDSGRFRCGPVL